MLTKKHFPVKHARDNATQCDGQPTHLVDL